jgi:hypothetical protein
MPSDWCTLPISRRAFVVSAAATGAARVVAPGANAAPAAPTSPLSASAQSAELYVVGTRDGFSVQIGTLVSMMNYTRSVVLQSVRGLTARQLDHLHDPRANSVGALLLHLAATEVYYQATTFDDRADFNAAERARWGAAMSLGDAARATVRGHELAFYLDALAEVRATTLAEFRRRDDAWLARVDQRSPLAERVNNHWKWFHVCEHESHHNGQIAFLRSRLPG